MHAGFGFGVEGWGGDWRSIFEKRKSHLVLQVVQLGTHKTVEARFRPWLRALPTETEVESGTSQTKSATSVHSSSSWKFLKPF